jgi:MFS family permease
MREMPLERYRAVLRAPGVLGLLFVGFVARGPVIAVSAVLTLHVVLTLHMDYVDAGLVATALTVATAAGAPWRGRVIDRLGLRRALLPSIVIGGGTWLVAPFVNYTGLLALAVVGGIFGLPSFAVIRQALAVAVGAEHRRASLALDSMSVELSFMTGPAIAVVAATLWSTRGVLLVVGVAQTLAGIALWLLNPPVRSPRVTPEPIPAAPADGVDRRQSSPGRHRVARAGSSGAPEPARQPWFTPALLGVFASGAGAALVLAGSEVAVVAQLRHLGHLTFTGAVFVVWGVTSIIGGFVYGALRREFSPPVVLLGLSLLTLPIGLASGPASVALLVGVAGLFCAPALTATSTALTHLVAEESRGEALGWQGAAMTAGSGLGAPLAGFAADHGGAAWGYLAAGAVGAGLALIALALTSAYGAKGGSAPAGTEPARNTGARVPADSLTD